MPNYSWITFLQARQALASRLGIIWQADPSLNYWGDAELGLYITEGLRTWSALTEPWNADYVFTPTSARVWYDVSADSTSPRFRTVTDANIYTLMEYHLLEPPTGATWSGTSQFSISDLSGALQRRRDEIIQMTGCNLAALPPIASTPNTRRTAFPDTVLEPRRARFVPDSGSGNPITLNREDNLAWDGFAPTHVQVSGTPGNWGVIAGPPLSMDVDIAPNVAGYFDVLALQSGLSFNPPAATLLGIPDDWSWVAKWGALADLLGRDSEATDRPRADYCLGRYMDGLKIMQASNWLLLATINGVPCDTPSVREMDGFSPEWQNNPGAFPSLVTAGLDLIAPCPVTGAAPTSVSCVLNGNAPVPLLNGDFVQCSRDVFDVILDYAQVLASFKMGGAEFLSTKDLEKNFAMAALAANKRLVNMGIYADLLHSEGKRQTKVQPK
jgi:hypothetical protein